MGKDARAPITDPKELLLARGRSYAYRGRYLQIQVFSKYLPEMHALQKAYGGHYYKHGTGFVWVEANRQRLIQIVDELRDSFPSEKGFEIPIITNYY